MSCQAVWAGWGRRRLEQGGGVVSTGVLRDRQAQSRDHRDEGQVVVGASR